MRDANHIIIMHNDGTFAIYNHLMRYGVSVNVGDKVKKGYPIGYSGNTGYSSGPHLHFAVFKATSPYKIDTLYIRFASTKGVVTEPLVGVSYTAK
jgi:murein DD-endopeptidase MepM/ murein hydrolase activator NlpD